MNINITRVNELQSENPKMNITKTRAIAVYKSGRVKISDWFYSDTYAKQWSEQFIYDEDYSHYTLEQATFFEEVDIHSPNIPKPHPVTGGGSF